MMISSHFISLLASLLLLTVVQSTAIDMLTVQKWTGFSQLSEVHELKLNDKGISKINVSTFSGMINLEVLDLSRNMITSLPASVFKGLVKLENLNLYDNNLTHLDAYLFNGLHQLRYLDLEQNNLTSLELNTFKGLSNLWYLDIDSNRIQSLDGQHIRDLKQLKYFFAKNNNITSIQSSFPVHFNSMCVNFLHFDNNKCTLESYFEGLNCKRIRFIACGENNSWNKATSEVEQVKEKRPLVDIAKRLVTDVIN